MPRPAAPLLLLFTLAASGCWGTTHTSHRDADELHLSYRMNVASFRHLPPASGSASVSSLFCAFPVGDQLYRDAMEDLHARTTLGPNQMLLNVREDHADRKYFGLVCTRRLTISADVVEVLAGAGGPAPVVAAAPPPRR